MSKKLFLITIIIVVVIELFFVVKSTSTQEPKPMDIIKLPEPEYDGKVSIERTLLQRRSIRKYKAEPLTLAEISQHLGTVFVGAFYDNHVKKF